MKKRNKKGKEKKVPNLYKLVIFNEATLHEKFSINLTKVNVFTYIGLFTILISFLVSILFIVTPLNNLLPRYHDVGLRTKIEKNTVKIDSLHSEIIIRDLFFKNLKNIIEGKNMDSIGLATDTTFIKNLDEVAFSKTKHDSVLKELIQQEEDLYLSMVSPQKEGTGIENINFIKPVEGMISNPFDEAEAHYGIDIVAPEDEPILSTLSGTVTMATWTVETGFVIQVQHDNNLMSIYKHNSELLKEVGNRVQAGEPIAIIGNSGEYTTGVHLHFELWFNGIPLNPEKYIAF